MYRSTCIRNKHCHQHSYEFQNLMSSLGLGNTIFEITLFTWVFKYLVPNLSFLFAYLVVFWKYCSPTLHLTINFETHRNVGDNFLIYKYTYIFLKFVTNILMGLKIWCQVWVWGTQFSKLPYVREFSNIWFQKLSFFFRVASGVLKIHQFFWKFQIFKFKADR